MILYLATLSLNVDNILSTESIAPLAFYKSRRYGYNSFYGLELIPCKNITILFSKIPYFAISDQEHDTRSVVLKINIDENINPLQLVGEHEGVSVYSTDTVIRLSPYNTSLLFFNPQDLNHTRLSCSDSLTNKLGNRFRFDLCRGDFDLARLSFSNMSVKDSCEEYEQKVLQDNRMNAIKGFMFGYYLGVSKSVTANSAVLLRIQKRIYDIVATIKNSGGYSSNSFYTELEDLDKKYRANDPNTKRCRELWESTLENLGIPVTGLNKLLESYDEKNVLKNSFMKKNGLEPAVSFSHYGFNNVELYRDALKRHTSLIVRDDQQKQLSNFDVKKTFDLDPSLETCMLAGEDGDSTIYNKFIDAILWHGSAPTPDTLRTDRFNIATQSTVSVKGIWESLNIEWKDSSAQVFMNELRQNIKSFTPLDIDKQENLILKSIAAFILKGEDYESIVQFCEDNSFADYRYALALWGATQGYVKMSKPIISSLTKSASFGRIYKDILELLYNTSQEGELPNVQETITVIERKPEVPIIPQSSVPVTDANSLTVWQNDIRTYLDQLKNVPNKKNLYPPLESAFVEHGDLMNYVKFFELLNDYKEWKTTKGEPIKAWKSMVEHFCPEEYASRFGGKPSSTQETTKKPKSLVQRTLEFFGRSEENKDKTSQESSPIGIKQNEQNKELYYFYNDPKTIIDLSHIIGDSVKDVMWIFDDLKRVPNERKYYKHVEVTDNKFVIDTFCKSKSNNEHPVIGPKIEQIRQFFYNKYGI